MSWNTTASWFHLDTSARALDRLEIAARLAAARHARLIGLFAGFMPGPAWLYMMKGAAAYVDETPEREQRWPFTMPEYLRSYPLD
jgi:hypothetical protein